MKYVHVEAGNGYCGCDEEYLMKFEDNVNDFDIEDAIYQVYTYLDGAAGIDPDDEEFDEYSYEECIGDATSWEEIDEEEFIRLSVEEGIEIR